MRGQASGPLIAAFADAAGVSDAYARLLLDRLAAEDSPVLLVPRGDVAERVDWRWKYAAEDDDMWNAHSTRGMVEVGIRQCDNLIERAGAEPGEHLIQSRTVRSWSLPDGTRVEVTGPWTEVTE